MDDTLNDVFRELFVASLPSSDHSFRDRMQALLKDGITFSLAALNFFRSTSAVVTQSGRRDLWLRKAQKEMSGPEMTLLCKRIQRYEAGALEDLLAAIGDPQCTEVYGPAIACARGNYESRSSGIRGPVTPFVILQSGRRPHFDLAPQDVQFRPDTNILVVKV